MQKYMSYLYPISKKVPSIYSGLLEITWFNGKKHLNSKNAIYSYGSLQKVLKYGLKKLDLQACKEVLILGMGGGSVIKTLRDDFNYKHNITAVEIDPSIIEIARTEFEMEASKELKIICEDAQFFIQLNTFKYDLIIIDLYIDTKVPSPFLKSYFWQNLVAACSKKGQLLFNAALEEKDKKHLDKLVKLLQKKQFKVERIEKVNQANTLILAKQSAKSL